MAGIFLALLVVMSFLLAANTMVIQGEQNFHTIVIGGGMAGMTAASELAKKGHKVLVVEANDYIGGRMKSTPVKLSENSVFQFEEGANWIHGSSQNHPITKLSKLVEGFKFVQTDDQSIISFSEEGQNVDDQVSAQSPAYQKVMEDMKQYDNISVYDAIKTLDESALTNSAFMSLVSHDIEFEAASPIDKISAKHSTEDEAFDGTEQLVTSGYQRFVIFLSKNPNTTVLLGHKATEVVFDGESSIVRCQNGKLFTSDHVIIAVPLGVLKGGQIKFTPNLPAWKEEAIRKINFGNVCKVLIVLKKTLETPQNHYIAVIPDDVQERGKAAYFVNVQTLTGLPALMTFGLGPNADQIEAMPEAQLKSLIATRLTVLSNQQVSSSDFQIYRSLWKANPNIRGAYSSAGLQTQASHWSNMAKPIFETNWYFSGEHTNSIHRATVHGAYESGFNAAKDILDGVDSSDWEYSSSAV